MCDYIKTYNIDRKHSFNAFKIFELQREPLSIPLISCFSLKDVVLPDIRRVDICFYPSSNRACTVCYTGPSVGDRTLKDIQTFYSYTVNHIPLPIFQSTTDLADDGSNKLINRKPRTIKTASLLIRV